MVVGIVVLVLVRGRGRAGAVVGAGSDGGCCGKGATSQTFLCACAQNTFSGKTKP